MWRDNAPALIAAIHGPEEFRRQFAERELRRMARMADRYAELMQAVEEYLLADLDGGESELRNTYERMQGRK